MNPDFHPYQYVDTLRGLETAFCLPSEDRFSACFPDRRSVSDFPLFSGVRGFLCRSSIVAHLLQTPGKQALGMSDNTLRSTRILAKLLARHTVPRTTCTGNAASRYQQLPHQNHVQSQRKRQREPDHRNASRSQEKRLETVGQVPRRHPETQREKPAQSSCLRYIPPPGTLTTATSTKSNRRKQPPAPETRPRSSSTSRSETRLTLAKKTIRNY